MEDHDWLLQEIDRPREGDEKVGDRIITDIIREGDKIRARYKIEVRFGPERSRQGPNPGVLTIWESGLKLHGGGDNQMFWCGYDECDKPMSSDNFGLYHVVCPQCKRECFLDPITKEGHIQHLKDERMSSPGVEKIPCVYDARFFRLTNHDLATLMTRQFRALGSNADMYLKYHAKPIRLDKDNIGKAETLKKLVDARLAKKPVIYPLGNILRDTSAGAALHSRFVGLLQA